MSTNADCFIVLPTNCANGCLILGRNADDATAVGVATEICYYDVSDVLEGKTDGGAALEPVGDAQRVILQKPKPGLWGGDFGANEKGVAISLSWSGGGEEQATDTDCLLGTDIVRIALAACQQVEDAVDRVGELVAKHSGDNAKLNFIVCDPTAAWLLSCAGKVWAAEKLQASWLRLPSGGLTVTDNVDKSSEGLDKSASFAAAHDAEAQAPAADWCGPRPAGDGNYTQQDMFETLRLASGLGSRAANVSVLSGGKGSGGSISCHWFTGTPNAADSVFKPFVFAPKPRISPLTQVQADAEQTLLHSLHGNRKPAALEHLRSLERSCVDELNNYFSIQDHASDELDELLKDCVEAEVKFYR
ncbi:secernin-3 [Drosophila grimshawi]|uniref:GH19004 n=1 Tax=Drosophila grimshawi TaxID=7222 RepID=B4JHW9_DROGR|nr:secernin-3 [Drosophila grimshawi]EDV92877.1 GH19004 [Drosophila grimshawi]